MPAQLSPVEVGLVQSRNSAARAMIESVAQTGSGQFNQTVLDYQQVWNSTRAATNAQSQYVLGRNVWYGLEEDGMFGPQTSGTVALIMGDPPPPRRARDMPIWYARNRDRVTALAPMNTVPVEPVLDPVVPAPPAPESGPLVRQVSDTQETVVEMVGPDPGPPAGPSAPIVPPVEPAMLVAEDAIEPMSPAPIVSAEPGPPEVVEFMMEDTAVVATAEPRNFMFAAIGVGALALGGTLFYFLRRKRR